MTFRRFPLHRRRTVRRADASATDTKKLSAEEEKDRAASIALRQFLVHDVCGGDASKVETMLNEVVTAIEPGLVTLTKKHRTSLVSAIALLSIVERQLLTDPPEVRRAILRMGRSIAAETAAHEMAEKLATRIVGAIEDARDVRIAQSNAEKNGKN